MALNIFAYQLGAPLARGPYADVSAWLSHAETCPFAGHVERALWAGFHADRLGYAFAAGYEAALARLVKSAQSGPSGPASRDAPVTPRTLPSGAFAVLPFGPRLSLCVTEAGGGHPRAIAMRLDKRGGAAVLSGEKTFATLAPVASELIVLASRGLEADGRNRLRLVRVRPGARGVTITPREATPFAPEIPHAIVRFDDVAIDGSDVLPGDGYAHYVKPFRTLEDLHVLAAVVGYLVGAGRAYGFARGVLAELVSLGLGLVDLGARDPASPLTHVALAGAFHAVRTLIAGPLEAAWAKADSAESARWQRDLPLLSLAEVVRTKRTDAAWAALEGR